MFGKRETMLDRRGQPFKDFDAGDDAEPVQVKKAHKGTRRNLLCKS
jgi:hypothetical protein